MRIVVIQGWNKEEFEANLNLMKNSPTENVLIYSKNFFGIDYIDTKTTERLSGIDALVKLMEDVRQENKEFLND